jgi:hypothetical protein
MRSDNYFAVFVFFSLLGIAATTIFSSILISQNNKLMNTQTQENKK